MKISIIIPAYNEEKYIGRCLTSVFREAVGMFDEVIVVDNGSTDATVSVISRYPGVKVVLEPEKGVNMARQRGFREATGEVLIYLDADTEINRTWFLKILEEFRTNSDLAGLSGPFYFYDLSKLGNSLIMIYWHFIALPAYFLTGYMAASGNLVVRREALERIGGFDTNISFYGDDTDIARRLKVVGEMKFKVGFFVKTSARRLKKEGFLKAGATYGINFLSEAVFHRPFSNKYKDIR